MKAKGIWQILLIAAAVLAPGAVSAGTCGDGTLDPHEQCDDGDTDPNDGCDSFCRFECQSDVNCPSGLTCDTSVSACVRTCTAHCDCPQEEFCYYGKCLYDSQAPVYCCNQPGCPPGRTCVNSAGGTGTCSEDPSYYCETACDCGAAHCCKNNICVKDINDPWSPGGTEVGPSCIQGIDATYCCSKSECHSGRKFYGSSAGSFRCHDLSSGWARSYCGDLQCLFKGDCKSGEYCVDTRELPGTTHPGASCSQEGGFCVSSSVAMAIYGYVPTQLLYACTSCIPGLKSCEAGWRPGGAYSVQRVVGECGSCGNGACEPSLGETGAICAADCWCGDGVCDTSEVAVCAADCETCGDGTCDPFETPKTCPADCQVTCGDGSCSSAEVSTCPQDCGCPDSPLYSDLPVACGDGVCQQFGDLPEDCINCSLDCDPITDSDGDGTADGCDLCPNDWAKVEPGACGCGVADTDADGDGTPDCVDACPLDAGNDADADGLCESDDNCPEVSNPDQEDTDLDGAGDACDTDDDGDGVMDGEDNCPLLPNPDQADSDGDGIGDLCDLDADGDGVVDAVDQCLETATGDVVGPGGCSIAQICRCENPWKNHGAYVSCVAHAAETFVELDLIRQIEKDLIVSEAAGADCGHRKK